jgi:hypothetical protein
MNALTSLAALSLLSFPLLTGCAYDADADDGEDDVEAVESEARVLGRKAEITQGLGPRCFGHEIQNTRVTVKSRFKSEVTFQVRGQLERGSVAESVTFQGGTSFGWWKETKVDLTPRTRGSFPTNVELWVDDQETSRAAKDEIQSIGSSNLFQIALDSTSCAGGDGAWTSAGSLRLGDRMRDQVLAKFKDDPRAWSLYQHGGLRPGKESDSVQELACEGGLEGGSIELRNRLSVKVPVRLVVIHKKGTSYSARYKDLYAKGGAFGATTTVSDVDDASAGPVFGVMVLYPSFRTNTLGPDYVSLRNARCTKGSL